VLEAHGYDDKGYIPAEALKSAKRGVLEDGVQYFHSSSVSTLVEAVAPFLQEHDTLLVTHGAGAGLRAEWPHVIAALCAWPQCQAQLVNYVAENNPEIKKVALTTGDSPFSADDMIWIRSAVRSNDWDIVFQELYSPDTIDFYPLVTSMLATEPDIIHLGSTVPSTAAAILEAGSSLGYTGCWIGNNFDVDVVTTRVPYEYIEDKCIGFQCKLDIPDVLGPVVYGLYEEYQSRWPGEFVAEGFAPIFTFTLVLEGMKEAGSVDPVKVWEAIYDVPVFEHPYLGEARWGGHEVYGCDHFLMTPWYVGNTTGGRFTAVDIYPFYEWYQENVDIIVEEHEAFGRTTYR